MYLSKLVKIFCFAVVLIFCLTLLVVGVLAAGENTRAITFGQETDMLVINQTAKGISLQKNDSAFSMPESIINIIDNSAYYLRFAIPPAENNSIWFVKSAINCLSYYFS